MVFGHNSNIKSGTHVFHVQTEDRGESHALIDTTVYFQGRVLHRRTNNYVDLLPLNEDSLQALKMRVDDQHKTVLEEIRSGDLPLAVPPGPHVEAKAQAGAVVVEPQQAKLEQPIAAASKTRKRSLELLNVRSWLAGKQATLLVAVQEGGQPAGDVEVCAEVEGSVSPCLHRSQTGILGRATISFEMPKLGGGDAALVIRLEGDDGCAPLRYALRAKPRVPAV
jgi:hypothetical protein